MANGTLSNVAFLQFGSDFERELEAGIVRSEKSRAAILAWLAGAAGLIYFVVFTFFRPFFDSLFHGGFSSYRPLLLFGGVCAYELFFRFILATFERKGLRVPLPPKIGNALVETSIPSFVILVMDRLYGSAFALNSPPTILYFVFIASSVLRLDYRLSLFTALVAAAEYGAIALILLGRGQAGPGVFFHAPAPYLAKAGLIMFVGAITAVVAHRTRRLLIHMIESRDEKDRVSAIFGQHVSPAVMRRLVDQEAGGLSESRSACIMFLDIRNFTAFSQSRTPEEVVRYLNTLFDFMIDIVNRNNGIINKFLGDGFMAVFGAPVSDGRDSVNALAAAVEMIGRVNGLSARGEIPQSRIGVGLHCGEALTGLVGSAQRREYTVIGDVVNLASRIESLNKQFESQLLISADVRAAARSQIAASGGGTALADLLESARSHGPVTVKGRDAPVEVFQVV